MSKRSSFAARALLGLGLLAGLLGGCGGGGSSSGNGVAAKNPTEIVAATKAAADAATSAHVSGAIVSNGSPITLNLDLASGGGRGQLSLGGLGFELIEAGGTVYIKGSAAFYRHIGGAAAAQLLQGRWLKAPTTTPEFASIASLTDLHRLIDATLANHGTLAKTGTTTVSGQRVVGVTDQTKGGTLYVATTGKPYPIQIAKSGAGGGTVSFDRWNEAVTITPPANAIDITQLRSGH
jgi:hypothetical protein